MHSTNLSLLDRLRDSNLENDEAWRRFVEIYTPLLLQWSLRLSVPISDRIDLVQDTLAKLLIAIKRYRREDQKSFRSWLYIVLKNTWLDTLRSRRTKEVGSANTLPEPAINDPLDEWTEREYYDYVLRRIQQLVMADFPESSQRAFQMYVLDEQSPQDVATELGLSVNAVYLVRSRILKRIREELYEVIN